ncbi:MAG: hypothetical protein JJ902_23095, partial [Roseibium sp.]|nr:hypothetical protein [Roseibium sp.]
AMKPPPDRDETPALAQGDLAHLSMVRDVLVEGERAHSVRLLEALLGWTLPAVEAGILAKVLLAEFGTVPTLCAAGRPALRRLRLNEDTIDSLKLIRVIVQRNGADAPHSTAIHLSSWSDVVTYIDAHMASAAPEWFGVIYLNKKNDVLSHEILQDGHLDFGPKLIDDLVRRSLKWNASAVLFALRKNDFALGPSHREVWFAKLFMSLVKPFGIVLHDVCCFNHGDAESWKYAIEAADDLSRAEYDAVLQVIAELSGEPND